MRPSRMRWLLNLYPPYIGAGVKIDYIAPDWSELKVSMAVRWYNRNYVGTHFGGSLYSMVDPHIMLLLIQRLGRNYIVWDKSADIDFIKATKERVFTHITISSQRVDEITKATAEGNKYLPEFEIDIVNESRELIARVNKTIYIRRKIKSND